MVTPAWLTTVARNRLVDHWRSKAREDRRLGLTWSKPDPDEWTDDGTPLEPEVDIRGPRAMSEPCIGA